jgi:hypothetical protein
VGVAVFAWPRITHLLNEEALAAGAPSSAPSETDIEQQMREMSQPPEEAASSSANP